MLCSNLILHYVSTSCTHVQHHLVTLFYNKANFESKIRNHHDFSLFGPENYCWSWKGNSPFSRRSQNCMKRNVGRFHDNKELIRPTVGISLVVLMLKGDKSKGEFVNSSCLFPPSLSDWHNKSKLVKFLSKDFQESHQFFIKLRLYSV